MTYCCHSLITNTSKVWVYFKIIRRISPGGEQTLEYHMKLASIEIFKIKKGFAPPIMESILKGRNNTYNVRNFQEFETERKRTEYFALEVISYRSPQLWSLLPEHIRQLNSLHQFKRSARQWIWNTCPCRLCKVYLQNVGFL